MFPNEKNRIPKEMYKTVKYDIISVKKTITKNNH